MDFSKYALTSAAVFIQFTYPAGPRKGELIFEQMPDPANEGAEVDDTTAPVGAFVYGADTEQFKTYKRNVLDKATEARQKSRTGFIKQLDIEKAQRDTFLNAIKELVRVEWNGKKLTMPVDGPLFFDSLPDLVQQLDTAMAERENFMPALPKN